MILYYHFSVTSSHSSHSSRNVQHHQPYPQLGSKWRWLFIFGGKSPMHSVGSRPVNDWLIFVYYISIWPIFDCNTEPGVPAGMSNFCWVSTLYIAIEKNSSDPNTGTTHDFVKVPYYKLYHVMILIGAILMIIPQWLWFRHIHQEFHNLWKGKISYFLHL